MSFKQTDDLLIISFKGLKIFTLNIIDNLYTETG